ncbi:uncharacterized protein HMPREF1541_02917 [Cyphellophora europaea CBS 101466]|uniref:Uncharacterized protein n=1 Tax=Cyphellophora europaea (strain CBS 101466) TaxID=1220924 RepID=W2RXE8_CYPE1|nr:uncharacterized protein HMPREF1541_02917 [Cyphellophora europaea CBS 101466]ETN40985.1 hypothetical protein HMPREF1541_02917 [Cyphellophora europaea CBS 101466]
MSDQGSKEPRHHFIWGEEKLVDKESSSISSAIDINVPEDGEPLLLPYGPLPVPKPDFRDQLEQLQKICARVRGEEDPEASDEDEDANDADDNADDDAEDDSVNSDVNSEHTREENQAEDNTENDDDNVNSEYTREENQAEDDTENDNDNINGSE